MSDAEVVLTPGEVARHLGVSPSGLRRLAAIYAQLYGELPKDASGTTRIWTPEALTRLERARALMASGQARSIKDALMALERGTEPAAEAAVALAQEGRMFEALVVVAARLEALQDSNQQMREELKALRSEVAELHALPPGANPERIDRALEVELREAQAPPTDLEDGDEAQGLSGRSGDGPMVRAARWLERKLRGR